MAAGEIAARFSSTGPTISRHLSVLRAAGLVTERRDANRILYSLAGDQIALTVGGFLSSVCPEQMVLRTARKQSLKKKSETKKSSSSKAANKTLTTNKSLYEKAPTA
ncbi:hypothetical protein BH09ACT6_BH09ACT6_11940 [soil metagenome]